MTRRLTVRVLAASVGAIVGMVAMLWVQSGGGTERATPGASGDGRDTEPQFDAAPMPEPSSQVLLAWTPSRLDDGLAQAASRTANVDTVSVVAGGTVDLVRSRDRDGRIVDEPAAGWFLPLDAIAVDPAVHADFAGGADRGALADLPDGEAVLSRTSAELRRIGPGASLELRGGQRLVVSAVVDDTAIGAAELAVTAATGPRVGIDQPRYALLAYRGDRAALEAELHGALMPGVTARFRAPGETPFLRNADAVLPPLVLKQRFGEFAYQPAAPGQRELAQDPAWEAENIVTRTLPIVGEMRCHRAVLDAVEGALRELQAENLAGLVDPAAYAGCWNPRLTVPGGDLSHHAWGVAFDINYGTNPTGQSSVQDPRLVEVLERWGFTWGGDWLVPDPAHFEYLEPPEP